MFFHEDPGPRNQIVLFPHNGSHNTGAKSGNGDDAFKSNHHLDMS